MFVSYSVLENLDIESQQITPYIRFFRRSDLLFTKTLDDRYTVSSL